MPTLDVRPGGTLRINNRRLDEIIMMAYNIAGTQISGPRWLTELTTDPTQVSRFDIVAKVPQNATKEQVSRASKLGATGEVKRLRKLKQLFAPRPADCLR